MVSRNNYSKRLEETSERQAHFAIRKLTIGAASVLLGTSLWLAVNGEVAHADSEQNPDAGTVDTNNDQTVNATDVKQVVVNKNEETLKLSDNKPSEDKLSEAGLAANDKSENTLTVKNTPTEKKNETEAAGKAIANFKMLAVKSDDAENTSTVKDTENQKYKINFKGVDEDTGKELWNITDFDKDPSYKAGSDVFVVLGQTGYKLMNPEVLDGLKFSSINTQTGYLVVPDHDVDVNLKYKRLGSSYVYYTDENGNVLAQYAQGSTSSTSKSPFSDINHVEDSIVSADAIDIPGYELIDQAHKEATVSTDPTIIKFKYKKIAEHAEEGLPSHNGGGINITGSDNNYGNKWALLDSGIQLNHAYKTYGENHYEEQIDKMKEKYTKQGFTFAGILNDHHNDQYSNWMEPYTWVHFLPNKDVTVKYVDEDGNKLADDVVLSFNHNNPDQTNEGVDPAKNWNPEGEWKSEAKNIGGYKLVHIAGATEGKFTTFAYNVSYVYSNKATGSVKYIDDDEDNKVINSVDLNGKIGDQISYSTKNEIADLEKKGYVLVNDGYGDGEHIFDADDLKNQYEVHLKHSTYTENATREGSEIIRYVYTDGSDAAPTNEQKTNFDRTITVDRVNGKVIQDTDWSPASHTFDNITSPTIEGYHPDIEEVVGATVTPNDLVKEFIVTYTKNGTDVRNKQSVETSATVHYEGAGELTPVDDVQSGFKFEYRGDTYDSYINKELKKGSWNADSHTYDAVKVPEVEGYHAEITVVPSSELTVTHETPTVLVNVKYVKNDTEVKDKETKESKQTIKFVDDQGKELADAVVSPIFNYEFSGNTYDAVTGKKLEDGKWNATSHEFDTVAVPVINGYVAVSGYTTKDGKVVAGGLTSTLDNLDVTATVVYKKIGRIIPVDPSGKEIPNAPTPEYKNDPSDPTKVTPNEPVPNVPDYTPSVPSVTPADPTKDTPVTYDKNTTPIVPVTPDQPTQPTTPNQDIPPKPETPETPSDPEDNTTHTVTPHASDVPDDNTPAPHDQDVPAEPTKSAEPALAPHAAKVTSAGNVTRETHENTLPQTGDKDDKAAVLAGISAATIGLTSLFGASKRRRRKN